MMFQMTLLPQLTTLVHADAFASVHAPDPWHDGGWHQQSILKWTVTEIMSHDE